MDVEQLRVKRRNLEVNLSTAISKLVEDFKKNTGVSPYNIYIHMEEIATVGEEPQYVVGRCDVDIKL